MHAPQAPLRSDFNAFSTAAEVVRGHDLRGKVAVVTGGAAGVGLETTRALVSAGAEVIVPARDVAKAAAGLGGLAGATVEPMELTDPASIAAFAARFLATDRPLHLLVNNAGIMAAPLVRDARGYESQLSTNHLGHFDLTARLWPALRRAQGARVVALSSVGHRRAGVDFDDWNFEHRPYDRWEAYGQSKSANALFAIGVDARGEAHGIRSFSVHPGGIVTGLRKFMTPEEIAASPAFGKDGRPVIDPERNMKTAEQGAATSVWCAVSHTLDGLGGVYCQDCNVAEPVPADSTAMRGVRPWAMDPALAERLWTLSERLTGLGVG
jgi:NAD(P)-dependent dehydrogenase (short-subunit alcohol dehydrogenase family)